MPPALTFQLQGLGFHREQVVEAYLACEGNADLAVNYLMNRSNWS